MRIIGARYCLRGGEFDRTIRGLALDIKQCALEGFDGAGATSNIRELLRMVQNTLLVTIRL